MGVATVMITAYGTIQRNSIGYTRGYHRFSQRVSLLKGIFGFLCQPLVLPMVSIYIDLL